jgi:predicted PurR-regulated permease PerM
MSPATWRTIFLAAVGLLVLWLAYQARAVVTPLLVALMLAYILDPVARFLERRGLSRGVASATIVVAVLAMLVTVVAFAATRFAGEATAFYDDVVGEPAADVGESREFIARLTDGEPSPEARKEIEKRIRQTEWDKRPIVYFDRDGDLSYRPGYAALAVSKIRAALADERWAGPVRQALDGLSQFGPKIAQSANAVLGGLVEGGRAVFTGILGILTVAVLFPIYLFYSLVNLARVYDVVVRHLPEGQRARIVDILGKIHATISAFFRGRLITMLVKGVMLLALFAAFGVPLSYVCAAFGALASLVPVVGGIAAGIPPVVLALPNSSGAAIAGLVAGILVIEGIEGYLLIPALIGKRVGLHPLTVLVCTLVAGDLLGFFGMIVAVPLTAVLKILAAEFVLPEVRRRAGLPPTTGGDAGPVA